MSLLCLVFVKCVSGQVDVVSDGDDGFVFDDVYEPEMAETVLAPFKVIRIIRKLNRLNSKLNQIQPSSSTNQLTTLIAGNGGRRGNRANEARAILSGLVGGLAGGGLRQGLTQALSPQAAQPSVSPGTTPSQDQMSQALNALGFNRATPTASLENTVGRSNGANQIQMFNAIQDIVNRNTPNQGLTQQQVVSFLTMSIFKYLFSNWIVSGPNFKPFRPERTFTTNGHRLNDDQSTADTTTGGTTATRTNIECCSTDHVRKF